MKFLRISPFILVLLAASTSLLPMSGATNAQEATSVPLPATATAAVEPAVPWAYDGTSGSDHWGDLSDQYATCAQGKAQSPIDIHATPGTDSPNLQFNYQPSSLTVENSGYSIQVDFDPGSSIVFNNDSYQLTEFHFHRPSEHTINGKSFPMELQLDHVDAEGKLAIVSVLIQPKLRNAVVRGLWNAMRSLKSQPWTIEGVVINAADFLPKDRDYYAYTGSLTTPPCTEGVQWIVLQNPISLAHAQITQFDDQFPMSARPIQPSNGRDVFAYSMAASTATTTTP